MQDRWITGVAVQRRFRTLRGEVLKRLLKLWASQIQSTECVPSDGYNDTCVHPMYVFTSGGDTSTFVQWFRIELIFLGNTIEQS